jgi:hypothetical protein
MMTLLVAIAIAIGAPASASAGDVGICVVGVKSPCNAPQKTQTQLADLNYTGWVYLNLNYCAPGMVCAALYRSSTAAWKWTGKAWAAGSIKGGWVYVAPFGSGYRWVYTQESGWVAMYGNRFEIRAY